MTVPANDVGGSQAVIASLRAERDAALAVQAALAEVMEAISRSSFDLEQVLETIIESAARLCGTKHGVIFRRDGDVYRWAAGYGLEPAYREIEMGNVIRPGPETVVGRVAMSCQTVQIADAWTDADYAPKDEARVGQARTMLGVPLLREGIPVAVIAMARTEVEPFSDREIALVTTFADQAAIAMENARLLTEQRETLAQQTAMADVLQVINASPGDLTPVFDTLLEKALRLCESAFGMLCTYDGMNFHVSCMRGVPEKWAAALREPVCPQPGMAVHRIANGEHLIHVADITQDDVYLAGNAARRAHAELGGGRTSLWVALRKDGQLLGLFNIYRQEVRPFTEKQIALLESFAAQAVIAMENARLLTEQREALERQTATAEVLQVINASPGNLEPVFATILSKALQLSDAAFGIVSTFDGKLFHVQASHNIPPTLRALASRGVPPTPGTMLHRLVMGESVAHLADIRDDAAYRSGEPNRVAIADLGGARAQLLVALRKDGELLGAITVFRTEVRPFSPAQIALVEAFAAQAVIAMENVRLLTEQREALEQQTALAEVLEVINASLDDPRPVFEMILDKAHALCGIEIGSLGEFDGVNFRKLARHNYPVGADDLLGQPYPAEPYHAPLLRGETINVADVRSHDFGVHSDRVRDHYIGGGLLAWVEVPMWKDGRLMGTISGWRREARALSEREVSLLQSFADQAVIAMENARLITETREALERQTATAEVLSVINASPGDLAPVFDSLLAKAMRLCEAAFGLLFVHDGSAYRLAAQRGVPAAFADFRARHPPIPTAGGGLARILETRRPDQIIDFKASKPYLTGNPNALAMVDLGGVRTSLAVPLLKDEAVTGFIAVYRQEVRAFSDKQIALLQNFAAQAVIAMENARLLTELRRAHDAAQASLIELRAAQANLIQSEKMASLGQLTAGIAHEIKNPLNFVNNFASLSVDLLDELKEIAAPAFATLEVDRRADIDDLATTLTGNLEKIAEHGRRADGIVRSMLEHSRGASGERHAVDLNTLVEEALNLAYHGARAQDQSFNITLERDLAPGIPPIELNPQDITRVLLNLCSNGFHAARKRQDAAGMPYEPCLRVATRDLGDAAEIRVRDNGAGIPADIRGKLFQPFFTTKPTGEGTGLGLSITWDIVTKQHGGTIDVISEVGEFTEFTVTLPRLVTARDGERG